MGTGKVFYCVPVFKKLCSRPTIHTFIIRITSPEVHPVAHRRVFKSTCSNAFPSTCERLASPVLDGVRNKVSGEQMWE